MDDYNKNDRQEIFSKKVRAGKRTYFFDVKTTKGNDYYITITESKKRQDSGMYVKHKVFLYKEDFNKFVDALTETVDHVKTELMPEYDFEEFSHKDKDHYSGGNRYNSHATTDNKDDSSNFDSPSSLDSDDEASEASI